MKSAPPQMKTLQDSRDDHSDINRQDAVIMIAPSPLHWNESQSHIELTSSFCSSTYSTDEETDYDDDDHDDDDDASFSPRLLFGEDDHSIYHCSTFDEYEQDEQDEDPPDPSLPSPTIFDDEAFYRQLVHDNDNNDSDDNDVNASLFRIHCYHTWSHVLGLQAIYVRTDDHHVRECAADAHYMAPWFHYQDEDDGDDEIQCTTLQLQQGEYLVDVHVETRAVSFLARNDPVVVQVGFVTSQDRVITIGNTTLGRRYSRRRRSNHHHFREQPTQPQRRIVAFRGAIGYDGILRSLETISEPCSSLDGIQQTKHAQPHAVVEFHFDWMRHWLTNKQQHSSSSTVKKQKEGPPCLQTESILSQTRPTQEQHFNDWFLYQHLQAQPACVGVRLAKLHCYTTQEGRVVGLQSVYRSYFANGTGQDTPARPQAPLFHPTTHDNHDWMNTTKTTLTLEPDEYIVTIRTRQDPHAVYQLKILTDRRKVTMGSCNNHAIVGAKEPIHPYYSEYQDRDPHRGTNRRGVVAVAGTIQAGALHRLGFVLDTIPECTFSPAAFQNLLVLPLPLLQLWQGFACDGTYGLPEELRLVYQQQRHKHNSHRRSIVA